MTTLTEDKAVWDPYDATLDRDPYPVFARLRDEDPLYYNEEYDFFALSRHADVENGLRDHRTFRSGRGTILEFIKAGIEMPPGIVIAEDQPSHSLHRRLMARVFTPRNVTRLETTVRTFAAESLDIAAERGSFDFVLDLGTYLPMRTIGLLLGIPESDQEAIREAVIAETRSEEGEAIAISEDAGVATSRSLFADYISWRETHPSDDIMTDLLNAEFEDVDGTTRKLSRDELLTYITVIAGAGNDTTTRLIGWAGKVLAEHPDQRRELVDDPSLIPSAIEETLRFEPPGQFIARYVAADYTNHGVTVPEGSAMVLLAASANRDGARFPDADTFDIHRDTTGMVSFGSGIHFCLGAALARLEGRVALEEILRRFPVWDVDLDHAQFSTTSVVRGWDTMPTILP